MAGGTPEVGPPEGPDLQSCRGVRDGTAAGSPEASRPLHREPGEPGVALQELSAGF